MQPLKPRITQDPKISHRKPCIRGMRFPVEVVLDLLGNRMTQEEILADHPELEPEDIRGIHQTHEFIRGLCRICGIREHQTHVASRINS